MVFRGNAIAATRNSSRNNNQQRGSSPTRHNTTTQRGNGNGMMEEQQQSRRRRIRRMLITVGLVVMTPLLLVVALQYFNGGQSSSSVVRSLFPYSELQDHGSSNNLRVFAAAASSTKETQQDHYYDTDSDDDNPSWKIEYYTVSEQRSFLEEYGWTCQESFATSTSSNLLLERYDALLPSPYAVELWKYCMLYTGHGHVYWDIDMASPLVLPIEILQNMDNSDKNKNTLNWAVSINVDTDDTEPLSQHFQLQVHHAFLKIAKPKSKVALGMIRFLVEEAEPIQPQYLHETLALFINNELHKKRSEWKFLHAICQDTTSSSTNTATDPTLNLHVLPTSTSSKRRQPQAPHHNDDDVGVPCTAQHGEPCCQVWWSSPQQQHDSSSSSSLPVMSLLHARLLSSSSSDYDRDKNPPPFAFAHTDSEGGGDGEADTTTWMTDSRQLGMPFDDLPYVATVREYPTHVPPASTHETPNYFDILLRNNCLPHDKECFKCLKLGYKEGDEGGDCRVCEDKCPCYCKALCQVRPPPKRVVAVWEVTPPRFQRDPSRLIPRVIHQTWFEPVTKEAYPNMSRLIESFRQSGWDYEFYDDDKAAQFISAHFPPQVREAYDAIIPGAFKADLFRYCVLLIRGGVYADMDILLESNLDQAIDGSVGFLTAQDSPGETIGHRSCLWNGLMASTPGHPFLAQTIQNVVNNVRNRFTSVDYDDMLCPNPVLSVSHTVDTLFTCGPCILGASLNDVLKRHRQTGFDFGEIDLFETEKKQSKGNENGVLRTSVDPDDPRLLIPGRSLLLRQNKEDMGSHRFTDTASNLIIAATDMPEYDDRPKSLEHYSKSHVKFGVYGLKKLYTNSDRANEEIRIRVNKPGSSGSTPLATA